ncbi:hypothetical protein C1637_22715 [Chryseobacterium lactis]|uniref:Phospholipid carrier-dependent glycosyltransferase n=1 Tax=Chryseobacterium lactis TaxID=1241981 RepID=A0A3G6RNV2_CHRLC|nr:glycosyltransferase family 39 protein [Chryseobacterium lactis]AZA80511.1 phospholipid carrier-dependent glycosyltransferase [Chryseobacterium lactis]AZB05513.1 phospholipid carrier-dependent glycosyltransferase [Chryseobacterium lactis]PNW11353.1 hypothetical protein C1637_22715 [Chryseobacterium lactis]
MKNEKQLFYLLMVAVVVLLFVHLGKLYVDIMEARNFVSAREMVEEGHWIFTTMNGVPRYEKPPFPTWMSAWTGALFGCGNISALRFPAALSSLLLVVYFYKIVNFLSDNRRLATISSLVLITNFLVIYVGRRANWDIYSYSFMIIGIYYFILALKEIRTIPNYLFAGLFFGLSILSKGPVGPYVVLLPFYLGYSIVFGWPKLQNIKGIVLCALFAVFIGFSWYFYIYFSDPDTFLAVMEKEATARGNRDVKPFTRYLSFPVQTGVWIFYSVIGLIYPMLIKRVKQPKIYSLFFYWTLFSLILLSLIPSKKERYLFPMMIPLAATTGYYLQYLFQSFNLKRWELNLNTIIFTVLAIVSLFFSIGVYFLPLETDIMTVLFSITTYLTGIGILYFIYGDRNFQHAFCVVILLVIGTGIFGIPILDEMLSNNKKFKSLVTIKEKIRQENLKLYSYAEYSPEVWFRYQEVIPEIKPGDSLTYPVEKEFYLTMNSNKTELLKPFNQLGWKSVYVGMFDDNEEAPPSKNYSDRKIHYLYKITAYDESRPILLNCNSTL